ncbi:MAG: hypothetical protein U0T83_07465 [Bacteriovoracaceae bacterium]
MKLFLMMFILFSCQSKNDDVEVYDSPKVVSDSEMKMEQPSKMGMDQSLPSGMATAPTNSNYIWNAPKGWKATVKSNMRLASFSLPSKSQKTEEAADLSIVVLGGDGGGELSNINRWRGQLELAPIDEEGLSHAITTFKGNLGTFKFCFIRNLKIDQGMLTAMLVHQGSALFVKAIGKISTLEQYEKEFKTFVKDIHVK